ncbi:hypothetical protein BKH44_03985 [Helicobacter sp. 13S00477-4]|nr:hypothetical protein BKH44_03985 [Helicobacter sp. 13S00477-4]
MIKRITITNAPKDNKTNISFLLNIIKFVLIFEGFWDYSKMSSKPHLESDIIKILCKKGISYGEK